MLFRFFADAVLVLHLGFVFFAVGGGLLVAWRRAVVWFHLPAAAWAMLIQIAGWTCPLTPLENELRRLGGQAGYAGGFIEHYLLWVLYPAGLTRDVQLFLGAAVLVANLTVYWWARSRSRAGPADRGAAVATVSS